MCGGVEGVKRDAHLDGESEGRESADGDGEVDEGLQVGVCGMRQYEKQRVVHLRTIPLCANAPERADLGGDVNISTLLEATIAKTYSPEGAISQAWSRACKHRKLTRRAHTARPRTSLITRQ